MELLKKFLKSKQAIRAYWTLGNTVMSLTIGWITYMATEGNVAWAISILPFAQAFSQYLTKEIINPKL